jgi:hypothetical protein
VEQFPYIQGQRATEALLEILSDSSLEWKKITLESQLVVHDA